MLSLLGIAIVNFINISDKKKEESWESVKSQIETAAEQYFKSNEYLFEGLTTTGGNITGTISLGKLVNEDYLNAVTDPRTGKMVSYCTKVNVTRTSNGVFTTKIIEGSEKNDDGTVRCYESSPYPFPNLYKLCYKDLAGNENCSSLKYVIYYEQDLDGDGYLDYIKDGIYHGSKRTWSTNTVNNWWSNNLWN